MTAVTGGAGPTPHRRAAVGFAGLTAIHAGRVVRKNLRIPAVVVQTLIFPVMLLLTLKVVFGETMDMTIGGSYVDRVVPLMALSGALFGGIGSAAGLIEERRSGLLDRFRSIGGNRAAMLAGRVVADAARTLVSAVVLVAVGHLIGFRFSAGLPSAIGFLGLVVLYGVAFSWIPLALAARSQKVEDLAMINMVFLMMLFLNIGFVPVEAFPGFLQPIVEQAPPQPRHRGPHRAHPRRSDPRALRLDARLVRGHHRGLRPHGGSSADLALTTTSLAEHRSGRTVASRAVHSKLTGTGASMGA